MVLERESSGRWLGTLPELPREKVRGRSRAEVLRRVRQVVGQRPDRGPALELEVEIRLPGEIEQLVRQSVEARRRAHEAQREASESIMQAVRTLTESLKLSRRDAAQVLGVSHQRVHQLRHQAETRGRARRRARSPL